MTQHHKTSTRPFVMTKRPHPRKPTLTLVEVLVAATVIAVLLSIAVPTLAKIREPARREMCADNLSRLMKGLLSYAGDHQGKAPIRGWFSYTVTEDALEAYGQGRGKVLINLGMLYKKWIGGQYDMLYCPSTYATFRDSPQIGWRTAFDPSVHFTIGGYNYAVPLGQRMLASPTLAGANPFPPEVWSPRFTEWVNNEWQSQHPGATFVMPNSPALVNDIFIGGATPVHGPGVNVLYADGHVRHHDIDGIGVTSGNPMQYDVWYKLSLKQ